MKINFKELGFHETEYEDQEGIFLTRIDYVKDLPDAQDYINDYDIFEDSEAITEIIPGEPLRIQFLLPVNCHLEGPYELDSDEGKVILERIRKMK